MKDCPLLYQVCVVHVYLGCSPPWGQPLSSPGPGEEATHRGHGSKRRAGIGTQGLPPAAAALCYFICPPSPHTCRHMHFLLLASLQNRLGGQRRRPSHSTGECFTGGSHWGLGAPVLPGAELYSVGSSAQGIVLPKYSRHAQEQSGKEGQELLSISGKH